MSVVLPIEEDPRYRIYTASAGQTQFAIPFPFQQAADIAVALQTAPGVWEELSALLFDISGAGGAEGGMLQFHVGRAVGENILVLGKAVLDRLGSITRAGRFSSELTDSEFDRVRIIQQETARDVARAIKMDYGGAPLTVAPDLEDGQVLVRSGDYLAGGPNATAIMAVGEAAAASADAAAASAQAAANSATAAATSRAAAQNLVDAAQAAYVGFQPGTFYDLGRVTDAIQLFPGDLGRVTDL